MTAALFESPLVNHPFVDGNDRVALIAIDVFFRMNGWKMQVDVSSVLSFLADSLGGRGTRTSTNC